MKNIGYYSVKTFSLILTIFLILVCLFFGLLYYCHLQNMPIPSIGPFKIYVVLTPSMEPKLKVDDAVIIVKANPEDLKPGDIINFTAFESETNLTHRITKKEFTANGYEFRTKGDNSGSEDAFITTQDRILGKYFMRIPKLAKFLDFTSQKPYVIAILVAIILLIQFVCGALENKLGPAKSGSAVAAITADAHTEDPPAAAQQLSEQPAEAEQFAKPQQQEAIDEHARRLQGVFVESWEDEKGSASDETEE